jgi:formate dehydrogenase subunit gamma
VLDTRIIRFTFRERVVHWTVAVGFLYSALTGLSLWTPGLFWLASVFGGGETVRWGHPWGGVLFVAALGAMFFGWARDMMIDKEDRAWLRQAYKYATHDDEGLPEVGRFNGGQKLLFWTQAISAAALLLSGLVLWFPNEMPRGPRLAAVLVHPVSAVVSIAGIIVHIYMATAATPGSLRAMVRGSVTPVWASSHHARWYREFGATERRE